MLEYQPLIIITAPCIEKSLRIPINAISAKYTQSHTWNLSGFENVHVHVDVKICKCLTYRCILIFHSLMSLPDNRHHCHYQQFCSSPPVHFRIDYRQVDNIYSYCSNASHMETSCSAVDCYPQIAETKLNKIRIKSIYSNSTKIAFCIS